MGAVTPRSQPPAFRPPGRPAGWSYERLAFVLRYMEGMTIEEVASALSVSISTAKRWVNRGATKIADQVADDADLRNYIAGVGEERP